MSMSSSFETEPRIHTPRPYMDAAWISVRVEPSREELETRLAVAAKGALATIKNDRQGAVSRLEPLLAHLEDHIFDPGLNVASLKRACGVRDNSIAILFHQHLGKAPKAYIEERRLETSTQLLAQQDLQIWRIAELVGYSSLGVFSKAFNRWMGIRPRKYRKSLADGQIQQTLMGTDVLQRIMDGVGTQAEVEAVFDRLGALYPGLG